MIIKIIFYLFSVAFLASGIYTCVLAAKKAEDRNIYIVSTVFSFLMSLTVFYFANWGIIIN